MIWNILKDIGLKKKHKQLSDWIDDPHIWMIIGKCITMEIDLFWKVHDIIYKYTIVTCWWLSHPSEKYIKISVIWDDYSKYMGK